MADVDVIAYETVTVLESAARTADPSVDTFHLTGGDVNGLVLVIDCTAASDTPSVVFTIKGVDKLSGETWDVLASSAVTGTGTTVLRVFPSATVAANETAKDVVPAFWTVTAVHADTDSITYSVAAQLV